MRYEIVKTATPLQLYKQLLQTAKLLHCKSIKQHKSKKKTTPHLIEAVSTMLINGKFLFFCWKHSILITVLRQV